MRGQQGGGKKEGQEETIEVGVSVGVLRPLKALQTFQTVLCRLERRVQREGPAARVKCHVTTSTSHSIKTLADDRFSGAGHGDWCRHGMAVGHGEAGRRE